VLDFSSFSVAAREAITAPDGPLLIVAGPGAGKTTVLAARIAHLVLARNTSPASILALAFTTDATRTLKARLAGLLGSRVDKLDAGTFHAWGLRVVRQWCSALGYSADPPVVYGETDAHALVRAAAESLGWDMPTDALRPLYEGLERARLSDPVRRGPDATALQPLVSAYEELLVRRGAVDYAAMLALPLRLFRERSGALRFYQQIYRHVLVDEFQDLCAAQYALVRLLVAEHRNLTVVGDPRQVLYRFRGADVQYLLEFSAEFPEARVVALDENLRSTPQLVALANAIGQQLGYGHPMRTNNPPGGPAFLHVATDERSEATFVASEIRRLLDKGRIANARDVAVLYRTRHQLDHLVAALREHGLPYRVRGHADLFARREVRDVLAYLRLAHSPSDGAALARIVNVPPRRLSRLADAIAHHPVTLDALAPLAAAYGPQAAVNAQALVALIHELHSSAAELSPANVLDRVLDQTGYREWVRQQADGSARLAHLESLRTVATRAETDLGTWLVDLHLDQEVDPKADDQRVLLSTIHASKGREWPIVFLVGLEEGLLPHARALASLDDGSSGTTGLEDERRVFFVGLTRPRHLVWLSYCRERRTGDMVRTRRPSRFLDDLPADLVVPAA
jgi:DNA helicase-2/ATP-dependent DNA helicase PcrA